ncbi:MAG: hypothetical protein ABR588_05165 [Sphingomicrobium sp.]|nr:hypothetical protein [Sphingomonadales bacterium]
MANDLPPTLRLVVHNDDGVLLGRQAFANLKWATRGMVPNLLAVINGSGDAGELLYQLADLAAAIEDAGQLASSEMLAAELRDVLEDHALVGIGALRQA